MGRFPLPAVFVAGLILLACARRSGVVERGGAAEVGTAPSGAASSSARALPGVEARLSAGVAPSSAPAEPPPPMSAELRGVCPLEPGERPLRTYGQRRSADGGAVGFELLLTDRRLCERVLDARGMTDRREIPLHRILRLHLVEEPPDRRALRIHDLDFFPSSLPLGRRDDDAQGGLVRAVVEAWRAARATHRSPPMPSKPFEIAPPPSGPRHPDAPGRPRFNHAAKLARAGQVDAALYWLMEAAVTEGVGVKRTEAEPGLAPLRRDLRWPMLRDFLVAAAESWAFSRPHRDPLVLPKARASDAPLPVALYLHGIYSHGEVGEREQHLADELGIAILAVDATLPSGERRYRWSENAELDLARLDAALARHRAELGAASGPLLLYAFSQGAMAAGEVALHYPERFAGVLLMSPGFATDLELDEIVPTAAHARLILRCDAAAGEAASTVKTTRRFCAAGARLGVTTTLRLVADATEHRFPEDFRVVFRAWSRASLAAASSRGGSFPSAGP